MPGETLNLDKALEDQETKTEETTETQTEKVEETTETKETKEDTSTKTEEKVEEKTEEKTEEKDAFDGLTEITELQKQFVTLTDGRRVKVTDLVDGNMRQEDYTQKTMELSESRRQLDLAKDTIKVDTSKEEKATIDLTEQNKAIVAALGEMDETDPMAVVMKGIFNQNNQVIEFINNQTKANQQASTEALNEENVKNVQKLINDSLEKESKNYNLPIIKGADGEETNMRELWNDEVLAKLQATNENLTLAQYNHRVSQIGKTAYKRLRGAISVANAKQVTEKTGNEEKDSQKKETKSDKSSEETTKSDTNKVTLLSEKISNAFDTLESKRG